MFESHLVVSKFENPDEYLKRKKFESHLVVSKYIAMAVVEQSIAKFESHLVVSKFGEDVTCGTCCEFESHLVVSKLGHLNIFRFLVDV